MTRDDFTFKADSDGYMIYYKDKPIGGAGVDTRNRTKPVHWKHRIQNSKDNAKSAESHIDDLLAGKGYPYMIDQIKAIDALIEANV